MSDHTTEPKHIESLADLIPDANNANKGRERGMRLLEDSLQQLGAGRSVLADRNGRLIAGNKTVEQAGSIGIEDIVVVQTDGTQLVVVQRTDLDLLTDARAKRLAVADNKIAQENLEWDASVLNGYADEGVLDGLFSDKEIERLRAVMSEEETGEVQEDVAYEYRIIVECASEAQQTELLKQFEGKGLSCRALIS